MFKWFLVISFLTVSNEIDTYKMDTTSMEICLTALEAVAHSLNDESVISVGCERLYVDDN